MADAPGSGSIVTTGSFLVPGILAAAVVPFVSEKGGIFSINRVEVGVCAGGVAARTHPNPQFLRRYKRRVEITSKEAETARKEWHVAQWPPLAWLETIIKLAALILGIIALVQALTGGTFALPGGLRLVQLVILALLSLGLVAAIFDRLAEREIVAMIFVVINNLGHWGMVVALASEPGPGWLLGLCRADPARRPGQVGLSAGARLYGARHAQGRALWADFGVCRRLSAYPAPGTGALMEEVW